jgi:hypothetical protein
MDVSVSPFTTLNWRSVVQIFSLGFRSGNPSETFSVVDSGGSHALWWGDV